MRRIQNLLALLIVLGGVCSTPLQQTRSLPTDSFYIAGVVEFRSADKTALPAAQLESNLQGYLDIIASDAAAATDIIVFPESTLNSVEEVTDVPDPDNRPQLQVPCDDFFSTFYHRFLVKLSCQAKLFAKYVVVNLVERDECQNEDPRPCSPTGYNLFNTNVVFDRTGRVISRYRKVNLYGELRNTTYQPEFGIFKTDFGVTFGSFICFDILYYTPAQAMIDKLQIKDFIFTAMWFSQLPFLTAVQFQTSWSYANNVNLLAAGANNPAVGNSGSGIYAGRSGPMLTVMNPGTDGSERSLHVARVPKLAKPNSTNLKTQFEVATPPVPTTTAAAAAAANAGDILLKRDYLELYTSEILDVQNVISLKRQICYNETFCCNFELRWQPFGDMPSAVESYYTYRLAAYQGWRKESAMVASENKVRNCAIFACTSADVMDCGKLLPAENDNSAVVRRRVTFENILIEAEFPRTDKFLLMPNSLRENLLSVPLGQFEWSVTKESEKTQKARFLLTTSTDDLLTFAIYGNYFDGNDTLTPGGEGEGEGGGNGGGGAAGVAVAAGLIFVVLITSFSI